MPTDRTDEVVRRWALHKAGLPTDTPVESVTVEHTDAHRYSEYTEDPAWTGIVIELEQYVPDPVFIGERTKRVTVDITDVDPHELIREAIQFAINEEDSSAT